MLLEYFTLHQTASTLTFAMYMLTQHPDIAQRLREEILNTVGRGRPTFDQMKQMKYLRAFINGTLC
jgi:cytochrome P450